MLTCKNCGFIIIARVAKFMDAGEYKHVGTDSIYCHEDPEGTVAEPKDPNHGGDE